MPDRLQITVTGTVQGVGFRPFVHQLASSLRLAGSVRNQTGSVLIDVEGGTQELAKFVQLLRSQPPPLARIETIDVNRQEPRGLSGFTIEKSASSKATEVFVSPDVATCEDCVTELLDPRDRRYHYPFLNCVNCGPRLTIIERTPYDRARTTLKNFPLCPECRKEYEDPGNRRFHAQPIACPACGPKLTLLDSAGHPSEAADPLLEAAHAIARGQIVAVKGLGGYHLACDARDSHAVTELRRRKHREEKPLAVMVRNLAHAQALAWVSDEEARLLQSPRRPIVLLKARNANLLAPEVSGRSHRVGILLPYAPVHELLFKTLGENPPFPLVMTSANDSDEPILHRDEDAERQLPGIADFILTHNRPIQLRSDDSVLQVAPGPLGAVFVRRSRGYAPDRIVLPRALPVPTLALGAQLKNAFAWSTGENAVLSHHIGDLEKLSAFEAFQREITHYEKLFEFRPRVLVHDLHPDYPSTSYALKRAREEGLQRIAVQHHHAHLASCIAENRLTGPVIGVTFDGTGYGADGHVWGGEFLLGDAAECTRAAQLKYVAMPGGVQAIREPWRMAASHLLAAGLDARAVAGIEEPSLRMTEQLISHGIHSPLTSSMGRLFDAVSAILGIRTHVSYEGQAAAELESCAQKAAAAQQRDEAGLYPFQLALSGWPIQIEAAPLIKAVLRDRERGIPGPVIAWRFHASVASMVTEVCREIRKRAGQNRVVLSGGVFLNSLLLSQSLSGLRGAGFEVFRHRLVPPNDGGISLGQLAVAAARLGRATKEGANVPCDSRPGH